MAARGAILALFERIFMPNQPPLPPLTVRAVRGDAGRGAAEFRARHQRGAFRQAPLLLIDLETEEGVTGRTYLFCYLRAAAPAIASLLGEIERVVQGRARRRRRRCGRSLRARFTLIGVQGIVRMAMAGFDAACWDALAIAAGSRSCACSAPTPRPIPAYNSCGLGLMDDLGALADEAEKLLARGLPRGQAAARLSDAGRRYRRGARGAQAHRRRRAADGRLQSGALRSTRRLRAAARSMAKTSIGSKSRSGTTTMPAPRRWRASSKRRSRSARISRCRSACRPRSTQQAADYVMPDLERIGGVTGWREAAELAQSRNVQDVVASVSGSERASARRHADLPFLEYVDWADVLLEEPLAIADGHARRS